MTDEIQYETLKAQLIMSYSNRIKRLQQSIFSDLRQENTKQNLADYREKIMKADKNLEEFLNKTT